MKWGFLWPLSFWVLGAFACSTGPQPATRPTPGFAEVEVKPATSLTLPAPSELLKALTYLEGTLDLTEVRIASRDLELSSSGDFEIDFNGPFVIRLIREGIQVDEALPPFGTAQVPVGSYAQLDLSLEKIAQNEIPVEAAGDPVITQFLADNSLVIEGRFLESPDNDIDGSGGVSSIFFRFLSDDGNNVRIVTPTPFSLNPGLNFLFIAFKVGRWFDSGVVESLQDLNPSNFQNGMILLSDRSSEEEIRNIVDAVESNVEESLKFAPSEDDDFEEDDVDEGSSSSPF